MGGDDSCIIKCAIAVVYQSVYLFHLCVTTGKIGINLASPVGSVGDSLKKKKKKKKKKKSI